MSERNRENATDDAEPQTGDRDMGSTWSTIDGTAEVNELLNDEDLDNFLVEPIPDPLAAPLLRENT